MHTRSIVDGSLARGCRRLVALLCLVVLAPACTREAATEAITIAQPGDFFLYAPLYVAIDAGFFAKEGLAVTLVSTGGDEKTWAAVISGSARFGIADPTFVAISAARGQPGKVVASIVNGVPFWGVTFNQAIPAFKTGRDLGSYSVATFPAPSTAYTLQQKMFMDAGIEPKIRQGAFGTLLPMLQAGQADIALELEPNVSQAVRRGAKVVYSMKDLYGDFAITGMTTTDEVIAQRPELVTKATCGLQRALSFIRNNREQTLQLLAKRFPEVDAAVAADAMDRVTKANIIPQSVVFTEEAWTRAVSVRQAVGDLKDPKGMATYVDLRFAETASRQCAR